MKDLSTITGKKIELSVFFEAIPRPEVTWTHGGYNISGRNRFKVTETNEMTKLTVSNVETADAGKYALKLKNVAGVEETSCQVDVHGRGF